MGLFCSSQFLSLYYIYIYIYVDLRHPVYSVTEKSAVIYFYVIALHLWQNNQWNNPLFQLPFWQLVWGSHWMFKIRLAVVRYDCYNYKNIQLFKYLFKQILTFFTLICCVHKKHTYFSLFRHAALMAISAVGEGCHKQMEVLLPQIMDLVIRHLQDSVSIMTHLLYNFIWQLLI